MGNKRRGGWARRWRIKKKKERGNGGGWEKEKYDKSEIIKRERDNARHYSISVKYILTDSRRLSGWKSSSEYARTLLRDYEKSLRWDRSTKAISHNSTCVTWELRRRFASLRSYDSLLDLSWLFVHKSARIKFFTPARVTTRSICALIDLASRRSSGSTMRVVLGVPYVGIETGMENDRRRVRIEGKGGLASTRGQSRDRVAKWDRDGLDRGRARRGTRDVRYNDVGSFTVVRHFGTCFPINMHVLVP